MDMLSQGLEWVVAGLFVGSLILNVVVVNAIGNGSLNTPFISFGVGIFLVGLSRLFLFLADSGQYQLHDVNMHIWWHLIFYAGMLAFIWGGSRLKEISGTLTHKAFDTRDIVVLALITFVGVVVFFVAQPLEPVIASLFVGSIIDSYGLHHLGAMLLAAITAYYIYQMKWDWGKLLSVSVYPFLLFLILFSAQHLWELLTESLKVISVTTEFGEQVEQFIVTPALVFLVLGLVRVAQFIFRQKSVS